MDAPMENLTIVEKPRVNAKGLLTDLKGKQYLGAHEAIYWFRMDYPGNEGRIVTHVDFEHNAVKAEVYIGDALVSTGHSISDGKKSLEKLETSAVRRALANLGYGTIAALSQDDDEDAIKTQAKAAMKVQQLKNEDADFEEILGAGQDRRVDTDGRKQLLRQQIVKAVDHPYYKNPSHINNAVSRLFKADLLHETMTLVQAVKIVENLGTYRENGLDSDEAIEAVRKDLTSTREG
jgi:hypothetical protein